MRYAKPVVLIVLLMASGCARKTMKTPPQTPITMIKNSAFFDVAPQKRSVSYLYAPGLLGSEIIMGRYCPQFTSSATGEKVSWKMGGHVIGQPHTAVTFPEIDLNKPRGFTMNPIKAFSNRVRQDIFPLAKKLFGEKYGIEVIDNPDSPHTIANYSFNFSKANIAQKHDINALHATYLQHCERYPDTDIVLYGDSRGASTIFNFIATEKPGSVKAAVLEGAFDDIPHLIKHCICSNKERSTEKRLSGMLSFVMRSYKKNSLSPRDYAELITDDIPLLFVTSLQDWIVPPQCTFYLYNRLKERGHRNVHLLVLQHSSHPCYMLDNAADKELYESTVHAFYKQYNLPHNAAKAAAGADSFARTQPTPADLRTAYQLPDCTQQAVPLLATAKDKETRNRNKKIKAMTDKECLICF